MSSAVFVRMFVSLQRKQSVGCSEGLFSKQLLDGCSSTDTFSELCQKGNRVQTFAQMIIHKWLWVRGRGEFGSSGAAQVLHCTAKAEGDKCQLSLKLQFAPLAAGGGAAGRRSSTAPGLDSWIFATALVPIAQGKGRFLYCSGATEKCLIHRAPVQP